MKTFFLFIFHFLLWDTFRAESTCPSYFGRDGRDGKPGRDGTSVIGPPGRDGIDGKDGIDCIECAKGPKGNRGEKGSNGINGKPGPIGPKGITGSKGSKGSQGNSGSTGRKGEMGSKGVKGDKGVCDAQVARLNGLLDGNKKIKQSFLPAGYDRFTLYDLQWQSLHMAAAAACRGSTATGGSGNHANSVYPRKHGVNCRTVCSQTEHKNCDGEVSLHGLIKKATSNSRHVGYFYNYGCNLGYTFGDEVKSSNEQLTNEVIYTSYCCCRK